MEKKGFNLLKKQKEPETVWTKLYDWIVGAARLVLIIIEVIVVIAFGIRLIVDVQSKNLDEKISDKENIIKLFEVDEAEYLKIQNKTSAFNTAWTSNPKYTLIYTEINKYIPKSAKKLNVKIDSDQISINGEAKVSEIGDMETNFKNSSFFKKTELKDIQSQGSSPNEFAEFTLVTRVSELQYRQIVSNSN